MFRSLVSRLSSAVAATAERLLPQHTPELAGFGVLGPISSVFPQRVSPPDQEHILLAVPKKKVSHSRKAMRSANKGLQNINHIMVCPQCTQPKLRHHRCPACGFYKFENNSGAMTRSGSQS